MINVAGRDIKKLKPDRSCPVIVRRSKTAEDIANATTKIARGNMNVIVIFGVLEGVFPFSSCSKI